MERRTAGSTTVGFVALLVAAVLGTATPAVAASIVGVSTAAPTAPTTSSIEAGLAHPNIVFVLTDDLDAAEVATMPNVKALLADQGETFTHYFVSDSLCCPSRATTLRGQYAHNDGVESNGGANGGFEAAYANGIEHSTIGTWLQGAGYRTALIGKYLNGYPNSARDTYIPPGWDDWVSPTSGGNPYNEFDYTLNDNGHLVHHGSAPADYGTDVYVHAASDFIAGAQQDRRPFFLYLAPYAPHRPATPAPRDANAYPGAQAPRTPAYDEADVSDKPEFVRRQARLSPFVQGRVDALYRRRIQSLRAVDTGVGELVAQLQRSGQLANTYFVFTSDNGFHLGQHRLPAGKETAYEEDIHVPLVVRGPGVPKEQEVDALVGNVDLAPTFADLAGATPPSFVDGRSFVPFLTKPRTVRGDWRHAYLLEHWQEVPGGPLRQGNLPLEPPDPDQGIRIPGTAPAAPGRSAEPRAASNAHRHAPGTAHRKARRKAGGRWLVLNDIPDFRGLRTDRYTYVEYSTGERELYDLTSDPAELRSIPVGTDTALRDRLHAELTRLANCRGVSCRQAEVVDPDR